MPAMPNDFKWRHFPGRDHSPGNALALQMRPFIFAWADPDKNMAW